MKTARVTKGNDILLPFSGMIPDVSTLLAEIVLRDHPKRRRSPNPARQRAPGPGHKKDPHPIRSPEIYPPEKRRCPCLKKRDEKNEGEEDQGRKPRPNRSDWHPVLPCTIEEHLVCGYEQSGRAISQLILGLESENGAISYTGHVPLGAHPLDALIIASQPKAGAHPFYGRPFMSDNPAVWLVPLLFCLIECSEKTGTGLLMTPVYRGLQSRQPVRRAEK
ncbi:hypothetical protein LJC19_07335, partial [Oxalobacter sp. OttesenSCG-928-P03]|nr:hypothetical protein [Oxalobacter sp. OttesenSCG-928-P03]